MRAAGEPAATAPAQRLIGRLVLAVVLLGAGVVFWIAGKEPVEASFTGKVLGTTWTVRTVGVGQELQPDLQRLFDGVDGELAINRDSELTRFNAFLAAEPFPLSQDTLEAMEIARDLATRTGGAFDPTVAPLVDAFGFGGRNAIESAAEGAAALGEQQDRTLSPEQLATVRRSVGIAGLEIDRAKGTAVKKHPELAVNLSAIAKGFAVDVASAWLERRGVRGFMVEVGGETRVHGRRADGTPWTVFIDDPVAAGRAVREILHLDGHAVASSGTYRNYIERDGHKPSHIIDPRTGQPVEHGAAGTLASVTVVHPRCAIAGGWATGLMVLGPKEGLEVAEREGLAALFLAIDNAEGASPHVREIATTAFQKLRSP